MRIALNLKGLSYKAVPVHLVRNGGEQLPDTYRAINPSALVPSLQDEGFDVDLTPYPRIAGIDAACACMPAFAAAHPTRQDDAE